MSFQVFISYAKPNLGEAEEVRQALEASGISCWMAPRNILPGEGWANAIARAIEACRATVVILSPHALASKFVYREVEESDRRGLCLLPLRLEELSLPGGFGFLLNSLQWLDAFPPPSEGHFPRLIKALEWIRDHGQELENTPLAAAACSSPSRWWESIDETPEARQATLELADRIVRSGQTCVPLDELPASLQNAAHVLCQSGIARRAAPYQVGGRPHLVFAGVQLRQALACWVKQQMAKRDFDPLPELARFPLLAEGLAEHLHDTWDAGGGELLSRLSRNDQPQLEDVVTRLVAEHARDHAFRASLFAHLPPDAALPALRGAVCGGQQLMNARAWDAAGEVFATLTMWLCQAPAASSKGRNRLLAEIGNEQGRLLRRQGRLDDAIRQLRRTVDLAQSLGDELLTGIATNNLAGTLLERDANAGTHRREAIAMLEQNLERLRACDAPKHLAVTHHQLGQAHRELNPREAEAQFRQDVQMCRKLKDDLALADALDTLATFFTDQQRYAEAEETHQEELALFDRISDLHRHARALANLGRLYLRQGLLGDRVALEHGCQRLEQSCRWYSSIDVPEEYAPALENHGRGLFYAGEPERGRQQLERAIAQYRRFPAGKQIADGIVTELQQLDQS